MDFTEYQRRAHTTAIYKTDLKFKVWTRLFDKDYYADIPVYPFLKLMAETSELAQPIIKQVFRGDNEPMLLEEVVKEIGDSLWYIAEEATIINKSLNEIAQMNLTKLSSRAKNGTIKGNGDNR